MKKLLILILPILLCIFGININVKAASDSWYTPDLEEYTFNIPAESEDFIFRNHDFTTGNFIAFVNIIHDFGVTQNPEGALDFTNIYQTLAWVGSESVRRVGGGGGGGTVYRYGLTPMIIDSLPSYVSYNTYNTYDRSAYKGAVDVHVITYRLDFLGNYSMLLEDYKYDIVYSLEVKYEVIINYFDLIDTVVLKRGYTIHWYDTSEMHEYKSYTPMNSNKLQFQLINIAEYDGWNAGYDEGYQEGYQEGTTANHEAAYYEGYDKGYDAGYEVGHADARPEMDILLITLIMFIVSVFVYFKFRLKWVLIATALLWFVPIFLVDNIFVKIFSVIMIIATITITFFSEREEEY
jgi:hypothetical protein